VVHACSPSYSGGRDQEDQSSKQAGQIVGEILTQIHPSQKRAGRVSQAVGPEFKAQYWEKKKCDNSLSPKESTFGFLELMHRA
jgi:hypothetical protein